FEHGRPAAALCRRAAACAPGLSPGSRHGNVWVGAIPDAAIAAAGSVEHWLPLPRWEVGLALMALMTWVNLMSVRAYGEFEFWFSSIKVAAIISFIVFVGAYACGYRSPSGPTFSNLVAHGGFAPQGAF